MSKMSLRRRWKQTTLANKLMVVSTGIMAFATVFLVVAGTLQYLAAREQLQAVREQGNIMQRQLDAFRESSIQTTNQTNDLIAATRETANASQSVAEQNKDLVKHAGEQANASQTQAAASVTQAEAARQSARATELTAGITQKSFYIGERPYVWVREMTMSGLAAGQQPKIEVVFENAGRTPALNFLQQTEFAPSPQPLADILGYGQVTTSPSQGFIPAGGAISKTHTNPIPIDESDVERINSGKVFLYFYGIATYDDGSGQKHTLKFCGLYVPSRNTFQSCSFYNSTD